MAASSRPNYIKCCKIHFRNGSPKIAFTVTQSSVTHKCPLERSSKNLFVNCSWLFKQFHHEVSIITNTAKHNLFLTKITLVLGKLLCYRTSTKVSTYLGQWLLETQKRCQELKTWKKEKKKKRIKGIHFYTSLGTESVDVYSKSRTLFCHVGISIIIPTRP